MARAKRRSAHELEEDELGEFVRGCGQTLFRAAFWLSGDRAMAEDLVQATLLRAFVHRSRARANPEAYCRRILLNAQRDEWRRLRRDHERAHVAALPVTTQVDDVTDRVAIVRALAGLSDLQRQVVVFRFYLDLTVPATAELLGIPEGTVKSAGNRALARLHELLAADEQEEMGKHVS